MVISEVRCDRCGAKINADRSKLAIECGPFHAREPIDLCRSCMEHVLSVVASGPDESDGSTRDDRAPQSGDSTTQTNPPAMVEKAANRPVAARSVCGT